MQKIVFESFLVGIVFGATIFPKYMVSGNCAGCHKWVYEGWKTSLHSHSHYSKDPLYKAALEYVAKKRHKLLEEVEIDCAMCHNPRMSVKRMSKEDILMSRFGFKSKNVQKALNEPYIKDGINCIICHNIEKILDSKNPDERGYKDVVFGKNEVMVGPFGDGKSSYHKIKQGEHFLNPNKICFVCHYNGKNSYGTEIYSTGKEYESSNSAKNCVECHMSDKKERRISVIGTDEYIPKLREVRDHLFMGARNGDILLKAFDFEIKKKNGKILLSLINRTPHNVPTGFAGRVMVIEISFDKKLKYSRKIFCEYEDKKGRLTIPYLGVRKRKDNRFKPFEKRNYSFNIPKSAKEAEIFVYYKLIDERLRKLLKLNNNVFSKKYKVARFKIKL